MYIRFLSTEALNTFICIHFAKRHKTRFDLFSQNLTQRFVVKVLLKSDFKHLNIISNYNSRFEVVNDICHAFKRFHFLEVKNKVKLFRFVNVMQTLRINVIIYDSFTDSIASHFSSNEWYSKSLSFPLILTNVQHLVQWKGWKWK